MPSLGAYKMASRVLAIINDFFTVVHKSSPIEMAWDGFESLQSDGKRRVERRRELRKTVISEKKTFTL